MIFSHLFAALFINIVSFRCYHCIKYSTLYIHHHASIYNSCCPEGYATKPQALSNTRSRRHVSKGCKAAAMQLADSLTQLASTFDL